MKSFEIWNKKFSEQALVEFSQDESGIVWLKLKSLMRKEIVEKFLSEMKISAPNTINDAFKLLYQRYCSNQLLEKDIDSFISVYNKNELNSVEKIFKSVEADLYKIKSLAWGGDAKNSLDKQIVKYVKDTSSYDKIIEKIDKEISENVYNYTVSTWYNNWSTILTEYLFKKHKKVLSAVGKIKSVDFFIDNIPIDLKITYFPKEYLHKKRKEHGHKPELTELKSIAREFKIKLNGEKSKDIIEYMLVEHARDVNNVDMLNKINDIKNQNKEIIEEAMNNKIDLIKWLYENQGEMRFGSENRLFLILINMNDIENSWKLKRNFTLLNNNIKAYLDGFDSASFKSQMIDFNFLNKKYRAAADILFIFQ